MSNKRFILQTLILAIVIVGGFFAYHQFFEKKIAYVNLSEVYNKFEYAKNLEKKAELAITMRSNVMDSLKFGIEAEYRRISSLPEKARSADMVNNFNAMRQEYQARKEAYDKSSTEMVEQYEKQVWDQINKYVADYGKEEGLAVVMGGNGQGNVMYSDPESDHTDEVVTYINSKFQGH